MPDTNKRHECNAPGPLFVDQDLCSGCKACISHAPKNFRTEESEGGLLAYVCRQPKGDLETLACQRALEECPNFAVGKEDDPEPKPKPRARH